MRKADDLTPIGDLLQKGIFAIPAYQRDYAWTPKNCESLAEDVFRIAESGESHFLGSIVVMELDSAFKAVSHQGDPEKIDATSQIDLYHVVDGQQRLTSCSLFLCALRDELREEDDEAFPSTSTLKSKTGILNSIQKFLTNDEVEINEEAAPRLFLNNDPSIQYQNCLFKSVSRAQGRKLSNAYIRYRNLIQENKKQGNHLELHEYYTKVRNAITRYLKVDDIYCDNFGSAFQIFESINAKGLSLTSVDLIKCFLMQKAEENITDAHKRWNTLRETTGATPDDTTALDKFMQAFLFTESGERVSGKNAYDTFKSLYANTSYAEIFEQIQTAAICYKSLVLEEDKWGENDPRKAFKVLGLTSIYVPLLAYARNRSEGADDKELRRLESLLLPFAIRYQVCGRPSNALDAPFKDMIACAKESADAEEVFKHIKKLTPSNDLFHNAFEELTFADSKEALARYLLEQIEVFLETRKGSEKRIPQDHTLEHIIPKDFSDYVEEWPTASLPEEFETEIIRSIGNMVLLGGRDNSSVSNDPYSKKVETYKEGRESCETTPYAGFNLLESLVDDYPQTFEIENVKERARKLADYATVIWE